MKTSYSERDYSFGQTMLMLRTAIGLTQAGLAKYLGVSRRAMGEWETGGSYPKVEHLKQLIALGVEQQAFPAGQETEKIRQLWKMAHQKVLLDERWLSTLLSQQSSLHPHLVPSQVEEAGSGGQAPKDSAPRPQAPVATPRVDWGNALALPVFYGRE